MTRLVNLLLLVHIGLIFVALLLPALNHVRNTANQIRCKDNLRQVGKGIRMFARDYEGMRFDWADGRYLGEPIERRFSWLVCIEPYMEASDVYIHLLDAETWDDPEIRYLTMVRNIKYNCPANSNWRIPTHECASHYIGIAGIGPDAAELPKDHPRAGVFGYHRRFHFDDAEAKGAANVMVVAETATDNGPWVAGGFPTVRGIDLDKPPYFGPAGQFSSRHGGVANVLFLDNSVRALTDSIHPDVLRQMATVGMSGNGEVSRSNP